MFDWFINFFFDIFNIVMILIFLLVGMLVGIILRMYLFRPKNQILYCRERDGRGQEMDVIEEDAISLETNTDPPLRFYKFGRAFNFVKRGRAFTRFLAKEGTAYTWRLLGFGGTDENPGMIELEAGTLYEMLKTKWGKLKKGEFWKSIPEAALDIIRDNQLFVTVGLEPGISPKGYQPITESIIKRKSNEDMAELMAEGLKGAIKKGIMDWIFPFFSGVGAMALASKLMGWW